MFSILKWIFYITLGFLIIYVLYLVYKNLIQSNGFSNISNSISESLNKVGINKKISNTQIATTTLIDFFSPKFIAPLTVIPGSGWYENMDALYKQIYLNNMNANQANDYFTQFSGNVNNYNSYNLNSNSNVVATYTNQNSGLRLLFPSSWMMNLDH